jgi:hypothetical protein
VFAANNRLQLWASQPFTSHTTSSANTIGPAIYVYTVQQMQHVKHSLFPTVGYSAATLNNTSQFNLCCSAAAAAHAAKSNHFVQLAMLCYGLRCNCSALPEPQEQQMKSIAESSDSIHRNVRNQSTDTPTSCRASSHMQKALPGLYWPPTHNNMPHKQKDLNAWDGLEVDWCRRAVGSAPSWCCTTTMAPSIPALLAKTFCHTRNLLQCLCGRAPSSPSSPPSTS